MFNKFPSIESFHNLRRTLSRYAYFTPTEDVVYRAKVKLHGTNSGITVLSDGRVVPQSRNRVISIGDDNMGFAQFVDETKEFWKTFANPEKPVVIYGEWCGKGIMKNAAIADIDKQVYAIFAIQVGRTDDEDASVYIDPEQLRNIVLDQGNAPSNVYVLPWYGEEVVVNFSNIESMEKAVERFNTMVEEVEKCDPWVEKTFGVKGTGEGLVFYPVSFGKVVEREQWSRFMFKAKGEKHKVVKQKKPVQVDPEVANTISEFVENVVTENRLEQMARELGRGELLFEHRMIGPFIGLVCKDVQKETAAELEAAGLDWKQVNKQVSHKAREWYLNKITSFAA